MKPLKKTILIIGGVAAGTSAAAKAKRVNPNLDITIFEQDTFISYGACSLPYFIGGILPDVKSLIHYTPEMFSKEKGCTVKTRHRVEEIRPHRRRIVVRDLENDRVEEYIYDKLLIATGAQAVWPDPAWKHFSNVFAIKDLHDGIRINEFITMQQPKRAVIFGGGYIGMEMAEALTLRGIQTSVIEQQSLPMAGFETESREKILEALREYGVAFYGRDTILDLKQSGASVIEVITKNHAIKTDLLVLALGFKPESSIAAAARIRCGKSGGILTDPYLKTSAEHIYAAGACAEVRNRLTNKYTYLPLGNLANRMGRTVGVNLAGGHEPFQPVIPTVGVKIFDLEAARTGVCSNTAKTAGHSVMVETVTGTSRAKLFPGVQPVTVTLIYDQRTRQLLGANVVGKEGAALRVNTLSAAIAGRITVDQLSRLDMIYSPPFAPVWDPILLAAGKSGKNEK